MSLSRPAASLDAVTFVSKAWRPSSVEEAYEITDTEGEIPSEIHGTLFRNGPSQQILPKEGYEALHLFDGDGMVHAFRFDNGRVWYAGRLVRNDSFLAEEAAGLLNQDLFAIHAEQPSPDAALRKQPNTNVVFHGGKLMALVENSHPFVIDTRSLDPIGYNDFQGKMLGMSVSAHPKIDGRTGQAVIHGYQPVEPYAQLYVVEPNGTCSLAEAVELPYAAMMHDMAITERYAILIVPPIAFDLNVLMSGGLAVDAFQCKPELGLKFAIRPRARGGQLRWFTAPTSGFIFHPGNAYEEDGKIFMDACTYPDPGALLSSLRTIRRGEVRPRSAAFPFLYTFDLALGTCREEQLADFGAEFPRLDDRCVAYRNRFGYAAVDRRAGGPLFATEIMKYDRQGGPSVRHDFGQWQWPMEPVFAPRSADAAEDDGFVLSVVYDGTSDGSHLTVLDARNLGGKPLAKARLKHRIPLGFHGNFAAGVV
jgi:all-trans-8'-apo-beta-carotenal 15,15'-oxygenase